MSTPSTPNEPPRTLATAHLPHRVRKVLERVFALVSDELDHNLTGMLEEYEQQLFRMADHARNPGSESGYMQTLRTMRLHRADLAPRFMQSLEAGLAGIRTPTKPGAIQPVAPPSRRSDSATPAVHTASSNCPSCSPSAAPA